MGRPEKPILAYDRAAGGFACGLRGARERAGSPDYRTMAGTESCGVSYSQLSKAASGKTVPSWAVTESFIGSLNELSMNDRPGDPPENIDMWFERWRKAVVREENEGSSPLRRRRARHARPDEPRIVPIAADPTKATTPKEFILQLKILQAWSGHNRSEICKRTGVPRSTMSDTLARSTLPTWSFVEKFVIACGGRKSSLEVWRDAWRNICVIPLLDDAATAGDGVRLVEETMNLGSDSAGEQVVETVAYLKNAKKATGASIPHQRPAWLQDAVEGNPGKELVLLTSIVPDIDLRFGRRSRSRD